LGFKTAKIKLTDIFASEEAVPIKTTGRELREGIPLKINFPDGAMFLVEKR
jgi:hypothetical protein